MSFLRYVRIGWPAVTLVFCSHIAVAVGWASEEVRSGPVTASVAISPPEPVIGDLVELTIEVTAEPRVEVLMPEFGEALDRFTIIDFVPQQTIDEAGRSVSQQTYRLQPGLSGPQSIPPILIEFVDRRPGERQAPEGQDAYELLTPRLDFEVQSVLPSSGADQLKPPLGELALPSSPAADHRLWFAAGGLVILLSAIGLFWWRTHRAVPEISAYEAAQRRLRRLRQRPLPGPDEIDGFFVELSDLVRGYLEKRFHVRAPELTTEEFLDVASQSPDLSPQHQQMLRGFLQQADLVKFAGLRPTASAIESALQAAERFLNETREDAAPRQTIHA